MPRQNTIRFAFAALALYGLAASATAQTSYFNGYEYIPRGTAIVTPSLDGSTLEVHNIGSSGQDGVEFRVPSKFGAGVVYPQPSTPRAPGSMSSLTFRTPSGLEFSHTATMNSDMSMHHVFDYSSLGAIGVRIDRVNQAGVVESSQVFPSSVADVTTVSICSPGTPFFPWGKWYNFWHMGVHYIGLYCDDPINPLSRIIVTPEFPAGVSVDLDVESMIARGSNMEQLDLIRPGTTFGPLHVSGTGTIQLAEQCSTPTPTCSSADRRVRATGIGSTGQDCIAGDLRLRSSSSSNCDIGFVMESPPVGASASSTLSGVVGGMPRDVGQVSMEHISTDTYLVSPDFSSIGATACLVTAYQGDTIVHQEVIGPGGGVVIGDAHIICGPGRVIVWGWVTELYWNPWPIAQSVRTYWGVVGCMTIGTGGGTNNPTDRILFSPIGGSPVAEVTSTATCSSSTNFSLVLATDVPVTCPVDFNNADGVTVQDIFDFLFAWNSQVGMTAPSLSADFNGSGDVNVQDIFDYLAAWNTGC